MKRIPLVAAVGAALMYFFDPSDGKRRRNVLVDRIGGFFRGSGRKAEGAGRYAGSQAHGLKQKATHLREEEKPQPNDATLKAKVESEIFREAGRPKDKVDVNAENGVVYLRGEVDEPELITELEAQTRKVQGVQGVENLLHLPGEPVPTKQ
jgi:osmotically-inducible protein OsmY